MNADHADLDAVQRVVAAFERSDWTEIDVRTDRIRVHLATDGDRTAEPAAPSTPRDEPARIGEPVAEPVEPVFAEVPDGAPADIPAGAHLVVAPSPGIFWRSPEPGAPPFVSVGDRVDADTTLCIIEVMKLMSHLKAGRTGTVVAILGRNGVAVAKGEPLFAIEPNSP